MRKNQNQSQRGNFIMPSFESVLQTVKTFLIGRPLRSEELRGEKLNVFWGLPIMSSDAISSVAYGVEEILWVLIALGALAFNYMFFVGGAIVVLLLILTISYRQTIDSYPRGGGSYTVAKQNLGEIPGLAACAALIVGYVLTVAVSTTSGTAAITSAIPELFPYRVEITIAMIVLMTIGNLRGVRESARLFALPTYVFIASMLVMIVVGFVRVQFFNYHPTPLYSVPTATADLGLVLILRAFAGGCFGLTGVEAVSNAIPNFKEPSQRSAKRVLFLLAMFVFLIFGGTSYMASIYHAVPRDEMTVISQIATQIFGNNAMYYILQISTAIILVMAANTSFAGLPMLLSLAAYDGYVPRQFNIRGGRLSFSNGILMLSIVAGILVVIYKADTHGLIPLYAIGVFLAFTLSQAGMLTKWIKGKGKGWVYKACINGTGLLITALTVVIIGYSKMIQGAWIALVAMVILIIWMKVTKAHYKDVAEQLSLSIEEVQKENNIIRVNRHIIVLVSSLNKATLKAINYARQMSEGANLIAFNISTDKENAMALQDKWYRCEIPFPLIVRDSPYRTVIEPLMQYIKSEEHAYQPGDILTVVMAQFVVSKNWMNMYHNQTATAIRRKFLRDQHVAVVVVPYVLDEGRQKKSKQKK